MNKGKDQQLRDEILRPSYVIVWLLGAAAVSVTVFVLALL